MTVLLRTQDHAEAERRAFWQDVVCDSFVPVHVEPLQDEPFRGLIKADRLGAVLVSEVSADANRVDRTARLIARSEGEYLLVGVVERGSVVVRQDGRETVLSPGDIACYDTTRPYTLVCREGFAMLEFMLPHRLAHLDSGETGELTATRFSATEGLGALVSPFLSRLARHAADYTDSAESLSRTTGDLLATMLAERRTRPDEAPRAARRTTLLRVRAYIDQNLADPELSPERIAAAHHVSLRYLQKLFSEEETTITAWIRRRRLDGCRRDLAGPYAGNRTVASIGARWGFLDPAHFSRVFKAAHGLSPSDYRAAHRRR
ncbi:helix-turn-helix domain-containing protein [Kitasatospora sp. NPDC052896]|uniref:AraC-like ligand-binding domain-containing protein n=1 Tax=Kitasatospora sp. NPDC052896 TaxID=3364061 RepID=UPI0037CB7E1D